MYKPARKEEGEEEEERGEGEEEHSSDEEGALSKRKFNFVSKDKRNSGNSCQLSLKR